MNDKPIAFDAYQELAESYASLVDTKPHNAYYERPATLSLLPDVEGFKVLDAACGPGVYSEWLVGRGAEVIGVDASPNMIALAEKRLAGKAEFRVADLQQPLDFLEAAYFDLVLSPLGMDYVENWAVPFAEFHRILKPGGYFVFSVQHPFSSFNYYGTDNYFTTEHVGGIWKGFGDKPIYMPDIRRPLEDILNPVIEAGFQLDKILEPKVTDELKEADPKHYEELSKQPAFMCLRARKN